MLRKRCLFFAARLLLVAAEVKHSAETAMRSSMVVMCATKTQFISLILNAIKSFNI